jgi:hypothetical protein
MGTDYIPEKDIKAACWMKRFARLLVEQPDVYRTSPEEAAEIDAAVMAFRVANAQCWPTAIRNRVRVVAKNGARKAAEQLVRPASQRIRTDPRIAPESKVTIGLKPLGKRRGKIPIPASVPVLSPTANISGTVTIRVLDSGSSRGGKPAGAKSMELWERVELTKPQPLGGNSTGIPNDLDSALPQINSDGEWRFVGSFMRTPITIYPAIRKTGDTVSYAARWVTQRGERARFGDIISINAIHHPASKLAMNMQDNRRVA